MTQRKWRITAFLMVLFLCIELLDSNMFIYVQADGDGSQSSTASDNLVPLIRSGSDLYFEKKEGQTTYIGFYVMSYDDYKNNFEDQGSPSNSSASSGDGNKVELSKVTGDYFSSRTSSDDNIISASRKVFDNKKNSGAILWIIVIDIVKNTAVGYSVHMDTYVKVKDYADGITFDCSSNSVTELKLTTSLNQSLIILDGTSSCTFKEENAQSDVIVMLVNEKKELVIRADFSDAQFFKDDTHNLSAITEFIDCDVTSGPVVSGNQYIYVKNQDIENSSNNFRLILEGDSASIRGVIKSILRDRDLSGWEIQTSLKPSGTETEPDTSSVTVSPVITTSGTSTLTTTDTVVSASGSEETSTKPEVSASESKEPSTKPEVSASGSEEPSTKPEVSASGSEEPSTKPEVSPSGSEEPSTEPEVSPSESEEPSTEPEVSASESKEPSTKPEVSPSGSEEPSTEPEVSASESEAPKTETTVTTGELDATPNESEEPTTESPTDTTTESNLSELVYDFSSVKFSICSSDSSSSSETDLFSRLEKSDEFIEYLKQIYCSEEPQQLVLDFAIPDGTYNDCKIEVEYPKGEEPMSKDGLLGYSYVVVDNTKPDISLGDWSWNYADGKEYYSNSISVTEEGGMEDINCLYWYICESSNTVYLTDIIPSESPEVSESPSTSESPNPSTNVSWQSINVTCTPTDNPYEYVFEFNLVDSSASEETGKFSGSNLIVSLHDYAGNEGESSPSKIEDNKVQYSIEADGKMIANTYDQNYSDTCEEIILDDKDTNLTHYCISRDKTDKNKLIETEAGNAFNYVNSKNSDEHEIRMRLYGEGLDFDNSWYTINDLTPVASAEPSETPELTETIVPTTSTSTDTSASASEELQYGVKNTFHAPDPSEGASDIKRQSYVGDFYLTKQGAYQFVYNLQNTTGEQPVENSFMVYYDNSAPSVTYDCGIKFKQDENELDKKNILQSIWEFIKHNIFGIANDATDSGWIEVTATDEQTGIGEIGVYILKDGEKHWLNREEESVTDGSVVADSSLTMENSKTVRFTYNKEDTLDGELYIVAYNNSGLKYEVEENVAILTDDEAPDVQIEVARKSSTKVYDNFDKLNSIFVNSEDSVVVSVNEENFERNLTKVLLFKENSLAEDTTDTPDTEPTLNLMDRIEKTLYFEMTDNNIYSTISDVVYCENGWDNNEPDSGQNTHSVKLELANAAAQNESEPSESNVHKIELQEGEVYILCVVGYDTALNKISNRMVEITLDDTKPTITMEEQSHNKSEDETVDIYTINPSEEPVVTGEPAVSEEPVVTGEPVISEEPSVTDAAQPSGTADVSESQEPQVTTGALTFHLKDDHLCKILDENMDQAEEYLKEKIRVSATKVFLNSVNTKDSETMDLSSMTDNTADSEGKDGIDAYKGYVETLQDNKVSCDSGETCMSYPKAADKQELFDVDISIVETSKVACNEDETMITSCDCTVFFDEGYYKDLTVEVNDEADLGAKYEYGKENDDSASENATALCFVRDNSDVVNHGAVLSITGDDGKEQNGIINDKGNVNVSIDNVNLKTAVLGIITYTKGEKEDKPTVSLIYYPLQKKDGVWTNPTEIALSSESTYYVCLKCTFYDGTECILDRTVTKDGIAPTVKFENVSENLNLIDMTGLKEETDPNQLSNYICRFDIGGASMKEKVTISDLHLTEENVKSSLIQICSVPDDMSQITENFETEKYQEADSTQETTSSDTEASSDSSAEDGSLTENYQWVNIDKCSFVTVEGGSEVEGIDTAKLGRSYTKKQKWEQTSGNDDSELAFSETLIFNKSGRYLIRIYCRDEANNESEYIPEERDTDGNIIRKKIVQGVSLDAESPGEITVSLEGFTTGNDTKNYTKDGANKIYGDLQTARNSASSSVNYYGTTTPTIRISAYDVKSEEVYIKTYFFDIKKNTETALSNEITSVSRKQYTDRKIDSSFYGTLVIEASDKVGNKSYISLGTILVDLIPAQINISSEPSIGTGVNNLYYKSRTFTITLTDNYAETSNVSLSGTYGNKSLSFSTGTTDPSNPECTVYTATLTFDTDGEYEFSVNYFENKSYISSTTPITKEVSKFYIDKTAPVITNKYSNTDIVNDKYYNKKQSATLTIVEKFPVANEEIAQVKKNGAVVNTYNLGEATSTDTYVTSISFPGDGYYEYTASSSDMAGNKSTGDVNDSFILDTTAPTIGKENVEYVRKNANPLAKAINYMTFGYFCNESIEVTITASDETSGIQKLIYYTSDVNEGLSKQTIVKGKEIATSEIGNGKAKTLKTTFSLSPDFKGSVFVKAIDYANNESNGGNFLESNAVILKKQASESALKASIDIKALTQPNENGFYNKDFKVQLTAVENYDGMKNLSYKAGSADLAHIDFEGLTDLTYHWTKAVNIKASENDNNNVKVMLYYYDNVGNPRVSKTKTYKVDVTKPILSVKYDNNSALNETFYKENRVAEIKIEELNFDADDVIIKITRDGRTVTNMTPGKSAWSTNGITHTAHITFAEDGDYEFSVEYTDLADNKAEYVHEDKFTIDKTKPEVSVTYDNNNAKSQQYYSKSRTATITVIEHNFDAANVKVNVSRKDKAGTGVPHVSGWSTSGDRHTATVTFSTDGIYAIDVESMDIAGNESEDWKEESFTIDQTKPELAITGVKNSTAYAGKVVPVITYKDTNLSENSVQISIAGYKRGKVNVSYKESTVNGSKVRTLDMFPQKKSVDDVYTLNVTVVDKAGNSVTKKVLFSVNRFGSNYYIEDETTTSILNSYTKDEKDVIIEEINVRDLKDYAVTCSKDGVITTLKEGTDYVVDVQNSEYNWRKYVYTIYSKNFTSEGNYSICVSSTDEAGNISNNEEKEQNIRFTIDKTAPTLTTAGIESDTIYNAAIGILDMIATDNIMVNKVTLYLNNEVYHKWNRDEIEEQFGQLEIDIPGSDNRQNIMIELSDIAGNVNNYSINDFLITQNKWVQYYNNRKAVVGTIGGAGMTLAAVCFVLLRRKRS